DPGFKPKGVITTYIAPRNEPGQPPPDRSALFTEILDRVSHAPGVVSAAASVGGVPFGFRARINGLRVKGDEAGQPPVRIEPVTLDYHKERRIALERGRLFDGRDYAGGPLSVILSESTARTFFPGDDPIGRTVLMDGAERTVVGVVGDVRHGSLEVSPRME